MQLVKSILTPALLAAAVLFSGIASAQHGRPTPSPVETFIEPADVKTIKPVWQQEASRGGAWVAEIEFDFKKLKFEAAMKRHFHTEGNIAAQVHQMRWQHFHHRACFFAALPAGDAGCTAPAKLIEMSYGIDGAKLSSKQKLCVTQMRSLSGEKFQQHTSSWHTAGSDRLDNVVVPQVQTYKPEDDFFKSTENAPGEGYATSFAQFVADSCNLKDATQITVDLAGTDGKYKMTNQFEGTLWQTFFWEDKNPATDAEIAKRNTELSRRYDQLKRYKQCEDHFFTPCIDCDECKPGAHTFPQCKKCCCEGR